MVLMTNIPCAEVKYVDGRCAVDEHSNAAVVTIGVDVGVFIESIGQPAYKCTVLLQTVVFFVPLGCFTFLVSSEISSCHAWR